MLAGGYPVAPFVAAAEDDPMVTFPPGQGLLAMPPPPTTSPIRRAPRPGVLRPSSPAAVCSTPPRPAASRRRSSGADDFHLLHVNPPATVVDAVATGGLGAQLGALAAANPGGLLAVVALGGNRTADRHANQAEDELQALAAAAEDVVQGVPGALVIITSRGATTIDDPGCRLHGRAARASAAHPDRPRRARRRRHRSAGNAADLPATILSALGAPPPPTSPRGPGQRERPSAASPSRPPLPRRRVRSSCARFSIRGINRPDGRTRNSLRRPRQRHPDARLRAADRRPRAQDRGAVRLAAAPPSFGRRSRSSNEAPASSRRSLRRADAPAEGPAAPRHPARPYMMDYVGLLMDDFVELHGDRGFRDDPAIVGGIGSSTVRSWCSATRRAATPRRTCTATSACRARGLSQGAAPDGAGVALRGARSSASSTRRAPIPASAPRSAARPRRSRRRCR